MTGYAFTNFMLGREAAGFDLLAAPHAERRLAPHFHETFTFGMILKGECEFQRAGAAWRAREGDLFVIHPYELHTSGAGAGGLQYWALYPDAAWLKRLVPRASDREWPFFPSAVYRDSGGDALRNAVEGVQSGRSGLPVVERLLAAVISRHAAGSRPCPDRRAMSGTVDRACRLLEQHWSEDLRSSALADKVGLSRFHFIRLFRRDVGLTPRGYARNVRLIQAKRLIKSGVSLAETAVTACFSDQSHLTREFNRIYGISPGAVKPRT